jgi:hypothetical protein
VLLVNISVFVLHPDSMNEVLEISHCTTHLEQMTNDSKIVNCYTNTKESDAGRPERRWSDWLFLVAFSR